MDWEVEEFDHLFPDVAEDVSRTLPPEQKDSGPLALTVGVAGTGFTVTAVADEVAEQYPLLVVTV
jgi:hypothetical protein